MVDKNIQGIQFIAGQWPLHSHKPTIIFIHGAGNSRMFWKAQIEGLSEIANTVAIDLPGHGGSSGKGMDTIPGYATAAMDFISTIEALFPIPCGLSMGGAIALQLLLDGKERYRAGILINSGARLKVSPMILELIKSNYKGFTDSLTTFAISSKSDPSRLKEVIADAEKCNPNIVYNDFLACNSFDFMNRLDEITNPVLVLTADEDRLSPVKYGLYLKDHIKNVHYTNIQEAGHMSPVERPAEVNKAITEFLNKISA